MQVIKHYYDLGHQVASHTYQHVILKGASTKTIQKQMDKQANVIQKAIGKRPAVMRPPQGDIDSHAISVLRSMGYSIVIWDIDTSDWATHNFEFEKKAYTTVFEKSSMGHIALQHEVYDQTVHELVPWVIDYVKSKNMKFVTVSDCLGVSPYQS
ncbi:hypothetical protein G6F56_012663 [Rhizopus delemar]|nr:hypothetical protein G6F56_012663 [Rhizopus delemar]